MFSSSFYLLTVLKIYFLNLYNLLFVRVGVPTAIKQEAKGLKADRESNLTAMPVIIM